MHVRKSLKKTIIVYFVMLSIFILHFTWIALLPMCSLFKEAKFGYFCDRIYFFCESVLATLEHTHTRTHAHAHNFISTTYCESLGLIS